MFLLVVELAQQWERKCPFFSIAESAKKATSSTELPDQGARVAGIGSGFLANIVWFSSLLTLVIFTLLIVYRMLYSSINLLSINHQVIQDILVVPTVALVFFVVFISYPWSSHWIPHYSGPLYLWVWLNPEHVALLCSRHRNPSLKLLKCYQQFLWGIIPQNTQHSEVLKNNGKG